MSLDSLLGLASLLLSVAVWPFILLSRKQPVHLLAWLLAVSFLPFVGPLLWLTVGAPPRLPRLPRKKLEADRRVRAPLQRATAGLEQPVVVETPALEPPARLTLRGVAALAEHPLTAGNRLRLLDGAAEKYEHLLADIAAAQDHVHMEYYILRSDGFGQRLGAALAERARAGVQVRLLLDHVGSLWLSRRYLRRLRSAGVEVLWFHPLRPLHGQLSFNIRNHRKVAIIDGTVGYLGGMNLGDEYLGTAPLKGHLPWPRRVRFHTWHDLAVRLTGPVVASLQRVFGEDWHFASSGQVLTAARYFPHAEPAPDGALAQVVNSAPSDDLLAEMHQVFYAMISRAQERVWLASPYFLPDETIQVALAAQAQAGLDVRVLLPRYTHGRLVDTASRSFLLPLLEAGVRIFWVDGGQTLHAKALLMDKALALVGSANMDQRSLRINFETGVLTHDPRFAAALEGFFTTRLSGARELSAAVFRGRPWYTRASEAVARLAAPLF